jgi:hypothetical protein
MTNRAVFTFILLNLFVFCSEASDCLISSENTLLITPSWPLHTEGKFGRVKIETRVNGEGVVVREFVVSAEPSNAFIRPAKKALKKWSFSHSPKQERCFLVVVEFKLNDL